MLHELANSDSPLLKQQLKSNRVSSGRWELFRDHRRHVTALIDSAIGHCVQGRPSLALLGAGNCNDVDLHELLQRADVTLVDIDVEALCKVTARFTDDAPLLSLAALDLSGLGDVLLQYRDQEIGAVELSQVFDDARRRTRLQLSQTFDIAASCCVLTQLLDHCARSLGSGHPQLFHVACMVTIAHLRLLLDTTRPGGTALLITDTQSNESYDLASVVNDFGVGGALEHIEGEKSGFTATGRSLIKQVLADPALQDLVREAKYPAPWIWQFSEQRQYLVYGVAIRRQD